MNWDDIVQEAYQEFLKPYKVVWIPTSYRLPEYDRIVLVTVDGNVRTGELNCYNQYGEDEWTICDDYCASLDRVTAWAPLPEPYERREHDIRSTEKGI